MFNSSPMKSYRNPIGKYRKVVFQPQFFRSYVKLQGCDWSFYTTCRGYNLLYTWFLGPSCTLPTNLVVSHLLEGLFTRGSYSTSARSFSIQERYLQQPLKVAWLVTELCLLCLNQWMALAKTWKEMMWRHCTRLSCESESLIRTLSPRSFSLLTHCKMASDFLASLSLIQTLDLWTGHWSWLMWIKPRKPICMTESTRWNCETIGIGYLGQVVFNDLQGAWCIRLLVWPKQRRLMCKHWRWSA